MIEIEPTSKSECDSKTSGGACRCGRRLRGLAVILSAMLLAGCGTRYRYPHGQPGWHSPHYHTIFGSLQIVGQRTLAIEYAPADGPDRYHGELIITPQVAMTGFSTGEMVLLHGEVIQTGTGPKYYVKRARLWLGVGRPTYLTR
ncbi:MAG: hypothetical protein ACP5O1_06070 [Phycisphaerae bacterium]